MKMNVNFKETQAILLIACLVVLNSCSKMQDLKEESTTSKSKREVLAVPTSLYTETGTNPPFSSLNLSPTTSSVDGSTINVDNAAVEIGTGASAISENIKIHTLTSTNKSFANAPNFKRWWQLDGKTQVFRLFDDEVSIIDPRGEHPRIEAFSLTNWTYDPDVWHTWYGRYTIISTDSLGAVIFQNKNTVNDWAFQLFVTRTGNIVLDDRNLPASGNKTIKTNAIGNAFNIRVRDNGKDWECFLNNVSVATGSYNRPNGVNQFRWGMYTTYKQTRNSMIFVSGVNFN